MSQESFIVILVVGVGVGLCVLLVNRKLDELSQRQKPPEELLEIIKMLQLGSKEDRKVLLDSLVRNTESLNSRLDAAARVISQVQRSVGEMSEIGRGIKEFQEFLKSPKLRGNVGEQVLKELLTQMLPKQTFYLQYAFKSGEKVDAAIQTSAGIIPIDSKFPMENFRKMISAALENERKEHARTFEKDVKIHIDSISNKYIVTDEGTIDYALMYIPSEAVYYEIVNNPGLFEYASSKRILPVSPTTFYAYLRAILMSFEGQKIESQTREMLAAFRAIQKDYVKVEEGIGTLNRHLTNAYNMMSQVITRFGQLGQKITATQSLRTTANGKEEIKKLETEN